MKQLRRFLGMMAFYHKFIPHLSEILTPLYLLQRNALQNKNNWYWNDIHEDAFRVAKDALCSVVPLVVPQPGQLFTLTTDASDVAVGGALQQFGKPLGFFSRKLSKCEQKYSTFDKELLAVFLALKNFSYIVDGSPLVIKSDHKPLLGLFNMKEPSKRQWRWLTYINEFDAAFEHIKGKDNIIADLLSRLPENEKDSLKVNLLTKDHLLSSAELSRMQKEDRSIQDLLISKQKHSLQLVSRNGLMYDISKGTFRLLLPLCLVDQEIARVHNLSHPGIKNTQKLLTARYVWVNMRQYIKNWVKSCVHCQASKTHKHTKTQFQDLPIGGKFKIIHVDIVGKLPQSRGYQYLFTIIDRDTNWFEAIPLRNISTEVVLKCLIDNWLSKYGVPEILITDQGAQFTSDLFKQKKTAILGIEHRSTTAYHPQCNGKVERFHRTLKTSLIAHASSNSGTWTENLPWVLLGLRNMIVDQIGSPAQRAFGAGTRLPGDLCGVDVPCFNYSPLSDLKIAISTFPRNLRIYRRKEAYFPSLLNRCKYVWLRKVSKRTLEAPYEGPFQVLQRDATMKTFLITKDGIQTRVSADRLKPAWMMEDLDS